MDVSRSFSIFVVVVALMAGGIAGGVIVKSMDTPDDKADLVRELRKALTSREEVSRALQDRVRSLQHDLQRLGERLDEVAADPMRLGARGYEPLIALEAIGRMFYGCADHGICGRWTSKRW
jgi:hypothetical protein